MHRLLLFDYWIVCCDYCILCCDYCILWCDSVCTGALINHANIFSLFSTFIRYQFGNIIPAAPKSTINHRRVASRIISYFMKKSTLWKNDHWLMDVACRWWWWWSGASQRSFISWISRVKLLLMAWEIEVLKEQCCSFGGSDCSSPSFIVMLGHWSGVHGWCCWLLTMFWARRRGHDDWLWRGGDRWMA